jgi:Ni/Co efflux regulator RcnB
VIGACADIRRCSQLVESPQAWHSCKEIVMKTKLTLAICAALLLSNMAMAAQSDDQNGGSVQTKTVRTVTTVKHVNGTNETWYKEGGVIPVEYRNDNYVVQHWQTEHLNEPTAGSHWVRGDNGDFLLVDENTGAISNIIQNHGH